MFASFRIIVTLTGLLLSLLLGVAGAHAEPSDAVRSASARALFDKGLAKADENEWTDAAELFRRALGLRDSPVIRFNLGSALVELSKLVEAAELLRTVELDERAPNDLRQRAAEKSAALGARLSRLTIHVEGNHAALRVVLDDEPVAPALLGAAMALDAGTHRLRLMRDEEERDAKEVELSEGAMLDVTLVNATPAPAAPSVVVLPVARAVPKDAPPLRDDEPKKRRKSGFWWGVGAGVAVVAVGVVTGVLLASKTSSGAAASGGDFSPGTLGVRVPQ